MSEPRASIWEFRISHFCEKGRWAFDHHRVPFTAVGLMPGLHLLTLRRLGVAGTSVPVARIDGVVVQGSGAIIDMLDARDPARSLTPADPTLAAEARALEAEYDQVFGDDLRRVAYDILLAERDTVIAYWTDRGPFWAAPLYRLVWPRASLNLRKLYRMRPERVAASQAALDAALDALDTRLSDGRRYLVGDALSRADVAACALLSPLVMPPERPTTPPVAVPAVYQAFRDRYAQRPFWRWVEATYRADRAATDG